MMPQGGFVGLCGFLLTLRVRNREAGRNIYREDEQKPSETHKPTAPGQQSKQVQPARLMIRQSQNISGSSARRNSRGARDRKISPDISICLTSLLFD